jgi:polyribonucleotide nucleotidyltransferase
MDAGVPISAAVAGVAMGLVSDGDRYGVLTDIAGQEDHYGDMDFKVAGTVNGITALQMDIKISGLSREIMGKAMHQAREGRLSLLQSMGAAIQEPRSELSPYAPRIYQMKIPVDLIRNVIGPGGKTIRNIVDTSGARINVEDDGTVQIATNDRKAAEKAMAMIDSLTHEPKIGEVFDGEVKRIEPYGAFVEILPGQDGLLHISEVAFERIPDIRDRLAEGDQIKVKIIDIDGYDRIKLSHRAVLEDEMRERGEEVPERPSREPERDRDRDRGGRGGSRDRDRDRRGGRSSNDRRGGRSSDRRGGRGGSR